MRAAGCRLDFIRVETMAASSEAADTGVSLWGIGPCEVEPTV